MDTFYENVGKLTCFLLLVIVPMVGGYCAKNWSVRGTDKRLKAFTGITWSLLAVAAIVAGLTMRHSESHFGMFAGSVTLFLFCWMALLNPGRSSSWARHINTVQRSIADFFRCYTCGSGKSVVPIIWSVLPDSQERQMLTNGAAVSYSELGLDLNDRTHPEAYCVTCNSAWNYRQN